MNIINKSDKKYPENLRNIKNPPKKLYTIGNINLLNEINIAIVGSRNSTDYGERNAKKFAKQLSEYSINIISGMAMGIDTCAHLSCINNNGKTIAVLPSGFNNIYPVQNINLYKKIINNNGLIISEYPPESYYSSDKAISRNRIISALSICTIIVEAGFRSGTSITARNAAEQGKKVFCVPGNLENKYSVGTNNLIKNGANLLTCIDDIFDEYSFLKLHKKKEIDIKVPNEYSDIYNEITDISISVDELKYKLNMDISLLNSGLTILEIGGYITQLSGGRYIRNEI